MLSKEMRFCNNNSKQQTILFRSFLHCQQRVYRPTTPSHPSRPFIIIVVVACLSLIIGH